MMSLVFWLLKLKEKWTEDEKIKDSEIKTRMRA